MASQVAPFTRRGESLGLEPKDTAGLIRRIDEGFAFESLERLAAHTGIGLGLLASLIGIPERTLARRKAAGRLAPEESERLLRVAGIFEKSVELFEGDVEGAVSWLMTPRKALGDQRPLPYSRTELGAREVENLIGQLEHGVFA